MYAQWFPKPIVASCDPYGSKPYNDGHGRGLWENNPYSDGLFVAMKRLLAQWPNHLHFTMRGADFLRAVYVPRRDSSSFSEQLSQCDHPEEYGRVPYWRHGRRRYFRNWSFALLDGDHDAVSIIEEMALLHTLGCRRMVIDNADNDVKLWEMMEQFFPEYEIQALNSEGRARALAIIDDKEMQEARKKARQELDEILADANTPIEEARVEDEPAGVRDGE